MEGFDFTFPAGGGTGVPLTRQINTTLPLSGGGDLSVNRTIILTTTGVPTQAPIGTDLILFESGGSWAKNTLQNVFNAFQKIEFYANLGSFPLVGVVDVLYVDKAAQALYLWTGAVYNKLTPNNVFTLLGNYNALTNTPNLVDGVGTIGDTYIVSVGGVRNFGSGNIDLNPSDRLFYANGIWNKEDNTDAVFSVNGFQGIVVLTTTNIGEGTNLYFTTARVLATTLTGFVVGSNSAILATDSVLQAFGKTQGQINAIKANTDKVVFLDETSTIADIQANKLHIYVGNAPLTIDLDVAIPFPPLPIPTQQNFSVSNNSGFAFAIISSGGGSGLSLPARYSYASGITITDGGGGYWEANPANYVGYPNFQQVLSAGNTSVNTQAIFVDNIVSNYETRFYYDGFFAKDVLNNNEIWYNSRFIRKESAGSKTFFINMPNLAANAAFSSFAANFRPNVTGTVAYLSDLPIFLDETSTIADFVTGRTHYYIGETAITYDYDTLPYPTPSPVSNFNFVNLSVYDVIFTSNLGNYLYTLKSGQALRDIFIIDGGLWELYATEYIDNIYDLQKVTDKGNVTTQAIIVRNNPNDSRVRYGIRGQEVQRDDLGNRVNYYDTGIELTRALGSKSWALQIPDITANANSSAFVVNFRPALSGTVAYLSDIVTAAIGNILQNGNTFGAPVVIGTNDAFALIFETNAIIRATISNGGVFNIANLTSLGNRLIQASATGDLSATTIDPADISLLSTLTENVQDIIGGFVAGTASNISTVYNDLANTFVIDLISTAVVANAYGSATQIPTFTVDAKGRLILATNVAIAIPSTQVTDFVEASQDAVGAALLDTNSIDLTYNDVPNTITADVKVSPNAGNAFSILGNGAYVANTSDGTQIITAANTTTNVNLALIDSGKFEIDMSALTANTSIVVTNPVNGRDYSFLFRGNSNRNVTFPASFVWSDGLAFDGFSSSAPMDKVIFTYYASILQFIVKR